MKMTNIVLAAGMPMLLLGCAYQRSQEVTEQMARTEAVLEQAEQSGAEVAALSELQDAREKFADARDAYEKESESGDRTAMRLASQAEVDAKYASAKAQAQRQQAAASEVQQSVETLRQEARRNAANPSPVTAN